MTKQAVYKALAKKLIKNAIEKEPVITEDEWNAEGAYLDKKYNEVEQRYFPSYNTPLHLFAKPTYNSPLHLTDKYYNKYKYGDPYGVGLEELRKVTEEKDKNLNYSNVIMKQPRITNPWSYALDKILDTSIRAFKGIYPPAKKW